MDIPHWGGALEGHAAQTTTTPRSSPEGGNRPGGGAHQGPLSLKVSEGQGGSTVEVKVWGAGEGPQVILGAVGSCAGCTEFSGTAEGWGVPKPPSEALGDNVATRVLLSLGQVKGEGSLPGPRPEPQRVWASETASLALPEARGTLRRGSQVRCLEEAQSIRRATTMHYTWSLWVPLARAVSLPPPYHEE